MERMKCPFCGGEIEVVAVAESGELFDEDYPKECPTWTNYGVWSYGLVHESLYNDCPIATIGRVLLGEVEYETKEEAILAMNRRA